MGAAGRKSKGQGPTSFLTRGAPSYEVLAPRLTVIVVVAILLAIGLVMVYSASSVEAYNDHGEASYYLKRQLVFAAVGIACAAVVVCLTPKIWNQNVLSMIWAISLALLVFTWLAGFVGLGAKRWVALGPFVFQPSEFAKITVMLLFANLVVRYREGQLKNGFKSLLGWTAITVVLPAMMILIQPDLGTTLVLLISVVAVLWFGEVNRKWVMYLLVAVAALAVIAIAFQGFRSTRILAWLSPESDPDGYGYQSLNSYYAFANGGFFGVGLGNSTQKYEYLTYAYNDFIFAIIGEETGFLGCIVLIGLYMLLAVCSFRIGSHAQSAFGMIVCNAAAATIVFQALLNMGCVTGVFPVTGKPLPFISYGGSSMISTMILVGVILSVSFKDSDDGSRRRRGAIRERTRDGRRSKNAAA